MLLELALRYCLFVCAGVAGILQAVAAAAGLRGLSFFRKPFFAYAFAVLTVGYSLYSFFTWNQHYATGVIEGSQQFYLFAASFTGTLLVTLILASLVQHRVPAEQEDCDGLDSLKTTTMFRLLRDRNGKRDDD